MATLSSLLQLFPSFFPGSRLIDGGELKQLAQLEFSASSGLVALANGGQTGATLLKSAVNEVGTVANANDSVMLPLAVPGTQVVANNAGTNSMQVYGQASNPNNGNAGDTIMAHGSSTPAATGTGVAQAANAVATYICFKTGVWKQFLTS